MLHTAVAVKQDSVLELQLTASVMPIAVSVETVAVTSMTLALTVRSSREICSMMSWMFFPLFRLASPT